MKTSTEGVEGFRGAGFLHEDLNQGSLKQKAEVLTTPPRSCQVVKSVAKCSKGQKHKRPVNSQILHPTSQFNLHE
jgi:hypothetical protein